MGKSLFPFKGAGCQSTEFDGFPQSSTALPWATSVTTRSLPTVSSPSTSTLATAACPAC